MKAAIRPDFYSDWCSATNGGMRLEVSAIIDGFAHQLVTVLADEFDDSLWVQIYIDGAPVQIPAQVLRETLDAAIDGVHSEKWFDKKPGDYDGA